MKRTLFTWLTLSVASVATAAEFPAARPARADIHRFITLPASLKANQQATLYAKVSGYLESLAVDLGDAVKAGQPLGQIKVPELEAQLIKAQGELKVAEAELARLVTAQKQMPDLITPKSYDETESRRDVAKANLSGIESTLGFAHLIAPFDGVVTARHLDPGAFVPAATAGSTPQTAAVLTLMDYQTVRLVADVPEIESARVAVGQPVKFTAEGLPGRTFEGKISRQSHALDPQSRSLRLEADVPNADLTLRPGMYTTARIGVEKHANALTLPVAALVKEKNASFVFLFIDGRAKKTPIKVGFNDGARVEILDGIAEDATALLVGTKPVADGEAVTLAPTS